jgi:methylglutaconyl-CoA hydratase
MIPAARHRAAGVAGARRSASVILFFLGIIAMLCAVERTRIRYTVERRIARITLCRPELGNAFDDVLTEELTAACQSAARDQSVKVICLAAEGPAFCAGADPEYLERLSSGSTEENREDSHRLARLFRQIYEVRKPTVAVVQGPALAEGCGLASVCDFVIAGRGQARFGYPEVRTGFIPAIVLVFLMARVGEAFARELVLRGETISSEDARTLGLVNKVVPDDSLSESADTLAEELVVRNSSMAMGLCKDMFGRLRGMNLADALDYAANMNAAGRMTSECKQGIAAFLKKERMPW